MTLQVLPQSGREPDKLLARETVAIAAGAPGRSSAID